MPDATSIVEVQVGPQGRFVIPSSLRRALRISSGDVLMVRLENDCLVLEKPAHLVRRVKDRFAALRGQVSLADELIAERAADALRDSTP